MTVSYSDRPNQRVVYHVTGQTIPLTTIRNSPVCYVCCCLGTVDCGRPRRVEKRGRDLVVAPKKTRRQTVEKNGRPGRNKISAHRMAGSSVLPSRLTDYCRGSGTACSLQHLPALLAVLQTRSFLQQHYYCKQSIVHLFVPFRSRPLGPSGA